MKENYKQALSLRHLSQKLNDVRSTGASPLVAFAAMRNLQNSRPRLLKGLRLGQLLGLKHEWHHPKLAMWSMLANPSAAKHTKDPALIHQALVATYAWRWATAQHHERLEHQLRAKWNYRGRLQNPDALLNKLLEHNEQKLFFWHHYDQRGFLPNSWFEVLAQLRKEGWLVLVSSSGLDADAEKALEASGIVISKRSNLGLCLGAYRDFSCLLQESKELSTRLQHLVLANDSTLPLGGPEPFLNRLSEMVSKTSGVTAQLSGITDSVERNAYHLQSYLLMANRPLLQNKTWKNFWQKLEIKDSKDDLIDNCEIGLSQAMLRSGVTLSAQYSLIEVLVDEESVNDELNRFEVHELRAINLSLFAWKGLLRLGCPLVKKQVLFNLRPSPSVAIPLTELKQFLKPEDNYLRNDLEELLRSRYLSS